LGRGLEALLGRAGIDPSPAAPATHGSAAVAAVPPRAELGVGAARLILHKPEELEQAAASLPTNEIAEGLIDPKQLAQNLMGYMSEQAVQDFAESESYFDHEDEEEEEEE
jgi:hypothetical protein